MVKFKISIIILGITLMLLMGFYYIFSSNLKKDNFNMVSNHTKISSLFIKENLQSQNLFYESRISEWAISNNISETIIFIKDSAQDLEETTKKIELVKAEKNTLETSKTTEKVDVKTEEKLKELDKTIEVLQIDINKYQNDIANLSTVLKNKLNSFIKPLEANFYFLVGDNLEKIENVKKNFNFSLKFVEKVSSGESASDVWFRNNFLYKVYGVPIKSGQNVVATLFIGFSQTKKNTSATASQVNSFISYIFDSQISNTSIENLDLQKEVNKFITTKKEMFNKFYNENDISSLFEFNFEKEKFIGSFIPMKNFEDKSCGILILTPFTSFQLQVVNVLKYLVPIFTFVLLIILMIVSSIISKNYIKPYNDIELGVDNFIDGEEVYFNPEEMGEADGLARSINRLFNKILGKKETQSWDDPLFVTELNTNIPKNLVKPKDHYEQVFKMFITAHINNELPHQHIDKEEFKTRLKKIEDRLKKIHNVEEVYFEVQVDNGVIKLHPSVMKK